MKSLKSGGGGGGKAIWRKRSQMEKEENGVCSLSPQPHPPRCFSCSRVSLRRAHYLKGTGYLLTVQTDEWQWVETGQGDSEER